MENQLRDPVHNSTATVMTLFSANTDTIMGTPAGTTTAVTVGHQTLGKGNLTLKDQDEMRINWYFLIRKALNSFELSRFRDLEKKSRGNSGAICPRG